MATPTTVDEYLAQVAADRRAPLLALRQTINANLPAGFHECLTGGMIGWVVPHERYPQGYHCDPSQPLPFLSLAAQKTAITLYHLGLYGDPELLAWFQAEWTARDLGRLDMGKSCIRFRKPDQIPHELIGELVGRMTVDRWIALYEESRPRTR